MSKTFEELDKSEEEVRDILVNALNNCGEFDLALPDPLFENGATARIYNGRLFYFRITDTGDVDERVLEEYNEGGE